MDGRHERQLHLREMVSMAADAPPTEAPKPLDRSLPSYWRDLTAEFDRMFPDSMNEPMRATWQFVHDLLEGAPYPSQSWRYAFLEDFVQSARPMFAELEAVLVARRARLVTADERLARVQCAANEAWNYYQAKDEFTRFERGAIEALGKIKTALA